MTNLADRLSNEVLYDEYFLSLLFKLEMSVAHDFLCTENTLNISRNEFVHALKFADILSHSTNPEARNISYKIISILVENAEFSEIFEIFVGGILIQLGNFPAIKFLEENNRKMDSFPLERKIDELIKKKRQVIKDGNEILTDSQYNILKELKNNDYFSFSGPTSLGKSFVLKEYIREILQKDTDENIIVLIPTRALINQTLSEYREEFSTKFNINVSSHPIVSEYIKRKYSQHIFLFTPERLISYLSKNNNPSIRYLFVDEAQKITSITDPRSSIYYHAIFETLRKYAVRLIFSSPNISNPDKFLSIFEVSNSGKMVIKDMVVSQNRYFIDLVDKNILFFATNKIEQVISKLTDLSYLELIKKIGVNTKNIIYINSSFGVVDMALKLADSIDGVVEHEEISLLIDMIAKDIHKDYYLIQCLKKGVAFHHGKMPQKIRIQVEKLYKNKNIPLNYIFSTSTLLEGVNLPAKNIFILDETKGHGSKLDKIDFENLAGRAGRLTKELSGNIICLKYRPEKWKDIDIIKKAEAPSVESFLLNNNKRRKREFNNIEKALVGKNMSNNLSGAEKEIYPHMANLLLLHEIENSPSLLTNQFKEKVKNSNDKLNKVKSRNNIPEHILRASSSIPIKSQNKVLDFIQKNKEAAILREDFSKENIRSVLELLYDLYGFEKYEATGQSPMIIKAFIRNGYGKASLGYWTMLVSNWIKSEPLFRLVVFSINYHKKRGRIYRNNWEEPEVFTGSKNQINFLIEKIMTDIEYGIRFKLERYFHNYHLILQYVLGDNVNVGRDWSEFLEYGSTDYEMIELQNIGMSRELAKYIITNHNECIIFDDNNTLIEIKEQKLNADFNKNSEEYGEYSELFLENKHD